MGHIYSPIKKIIIIMPFAATWRQPDLILREVSQREKDKYHMISVIVSS